MGWGWGGARSVLCAVYRHIVGLCPPCADKRWNSSWLRKWMGLSEGRGRRSEKVEASSDNLHERTPTVNAMPLCHS